MSRVILSCFALAACHRAPAPVRPAIAQICSPERVGKVVAEGGTAADVPQLAVLEGTLDAPARTDRIATATREALRAKGYIKATVEVSRREGCGVELVVAVNRGPRFVIGKLDFVAADDYPDHERRSAIEDALGDANAIGTAYVPDRLKRALVGLRRSYQERGWLDVEIDSPTVAYDDQRSEVSITIPIRAGKRFRIGAVSARAPCQPAGRGRRCVARDLGRATRAAVIEALGLRGGQWFEAIAVKDGFERARDTVRKPIEMRLSLGADAGTINLEAVVADVEANDNDR